MMDLYLVHQRAERGATHLGGGAFLEKVLEHSAWHIVVTQ